MEHSTKQVIIRENPSARQAHTNPNKIIIQIKKSVKEQIRRIRVIRDRF